MFERGTTGRHGNRGDGSTAVTDGGGGVDEEKGLQCPSPPPARRQSRQSSLLETKERLEDAVARVMKDYQRARKEVLYGLDDLGRPLEEAAAAAAASGGDESAGGDRCARTELA